MIWLLVSLCLLLSFLFSGIEAGILSVNRVRLKHRAKLREPAALILEKILAQPERALVTVLVVTNLCNILALAITSRELVGLLGARGYLVAGAIFLPLYLLGLELLPKSLFRRFPYRALAALAVPLRLAGTLLAPMHVFGEAISRAAARDGEGPKLFLGREDFKYLTIESERTGTLGRQERQMIHNVVDFRAIKAADVMTPLADVPTIPGRAALKDLLARHRETHIDRWPVLDDTGEITGVVTIFDLALEGRERGLVESFQRRIVKVAPQEPAYSVLRKLRAARGTMAAVIEAGARPAGIVTWERLIERLVKTAAA